MSDLSAALAAVQQAYREGLRPVLGARWRPGRTHEGNIWAQTGAREDWKDDFPLGSVKTDELAGRICGDHNAVLDLEWLAAAGFDVIIGQRKVRGTDGASALYVALEHLEADSDLPEFYGLAPGDALKRAREWAEREGRAV